VADADAIAAIFNQGIEERTATFETRPQSAGSVGGRIESGELILVAEKGGGMIAWASASPYCDRHDYYAGIGEATMYVERGSRRAGVGSALLEALAAAAAERGLHKLTGKIFTANVPSIELVRACGWREVGVHRRHGRLDGEWREVLVVERLLDPPSGG
jgi:L-amino acid N-acyltransferase YncA